MSRTQYPPSAPEEAGFALRTERLGPLPLINHFIERIGLHEILSRFVPSDRRCAITHASALGVLLRSIIDEREPTNAQLGELNLKLDKFHGDWNYTLLPPRTKT